MKIKLDENLPVDLAFTLAEHGHQVETVPQEGLEGSDDATIWDAVQREGRFLMTQDLDFSDLRSFRPHSHAGIMILRLRDPSRRTLIERMQTVCETVDLESLSGCNVVVTDHKMRVRGLPDNGLDAGSTPASAE